MAAASCARRSGERFSFLFVFVAAPGFFASAVDAVDAEGLAPLRFAVARAADFLAAFNALADSASCSLRLNFASFCGPSRKRFSSSWIFLLGIVGLPYWIVLIPLHDLLLGNELRRQLANSPALWFTFGSLAASHFWKAFRTGYDTMPDKELKQRARWDIYVLILRAMAMFIMAAHGLAFILVPLMALLLSCLEIWPERALGTVFGAPSRLWEYDPGDPTSNRRRR